MFKPASVATLSTIIFLTACGTVPVPHKQTAVRSGASNKHVEMANAVQPAKQVSAGRTEASPKPKKKLSSAKAYWRRAVQYLQVGDEAQARDDLQKALRLEPGNRIATNLMHQIDADAVKELGKENFEYQIENGDSLSRVAQKFLRDPLKFHILAKYNGIDNPSRLQVGQTIRVPGKKPAPVLAAKPVEPPKVNADPKYAKAKKLFDQSKFEKAITLLESEVGDMDAQVENQQMQELLVLSYVAQADVLHQARDLAGAQELLQKAVILQPTNSALSKRLDQVMSELEAERLYQNGVQAIAAGAPEQAAEAFRQALQRDPGHALAQQKLDEIKPELVEFYYKDAMMAYRRQELDEAIQGWDKVLALDPQHENAKLYRARAVELKERLQKFSDQ